MKERKPAWSMSSIKKKMADITQGRALKSYRGKTLRHDTLDLDALKEAVEANPQVTLPELSRHFKRSRGGRTRAMKRAGIKPYKRFRHLHLKPTH